jgi:hypothetical protein
LKRRFTVNFSAGILGQQVFMGRLSSCNDNLVFYRDSCTGYMPDTGFPRVWGNFGINFGVNIPLSFEILFVELILCLSDWIGDSLFSSYQIAITDIWFQSMREGMSSTGLYGSDVFKKS